jgi:hypothetical protein
MVFPNDFYALLRSKEGDALDIVDISYLVV